MADDGKVKLYGSLACSHCSQAKAALGDMAHFYDCGGKHRDECERLGVSSVPHMIGPNGKVVVGWDSGKVPQTMEALGIKPAAHQPPASANIGMRFYK